MAEQRRTRRHGARVRCAGLIALALVLLAGCSEDNPEPEPLDPAASAASSTPSPTAKPTGAPTLPPQARGTSRSAAVPFVRHYVSVLNHSAAALAVAQLRQLSTDDCAACSRIGESVLRVRRNQGHFRGGEWTVVEPKLLPEWKAGLAEVQAVVTYPEQDVVEAEGEKPIHFEAGKTVYTFALRATDAGWRVASIQGVS